MDRRGKAVSVRAPAFICHVCSTSFQYEDDLQVHQMTVHSSENDLADDDTQTGAPPSFVENPVFGPIQSDFTPHDPAKIQNMLVDRIGGPETVEMPVIPPLLVPPSQNFFGEWRGIQGKCNSCYLDVFFMLFAFSTAFDGIFTQKALNESILLRIVLFEIVIPLRTRMYVKRDVIAMIRTLLADATSNHEYLTNTWDFTEFLMDLVKQVDFSNVCNFIGDTIACGFLIQLEGIDGRVLSLQQLINHTLNVNRITSQDPPEAFIVRMRPYLISDPPLCLPQSTVSLNGCSYRLEAIFCISRTHYTGFFKLDRMWVFFDSMSNSVGGHCVPLITPVPGFQEYLDSGCDERFLSQKNDGESRDSYDNRVKIGAFAFIFTREKIVPVLPPRIQGSSAALPSGLAQPTPSSRRYSAGGGAAATSSSHSHPKLTSFEHFQQKRSAQVTFDGSKFPPLNYSLALFDATTCLVKKSVQHLSSFSVDNLMLVCDDLRGDGKKEPIQVFGSFGFLDAKGVEHRFRATGFVFEDGNVVNHEGSVESLRDPGIKDAFMRRVGGKWQSSIITSITFTKCN